jgi:hypothetical protein
MFDTIIIIPYRNREKHLNYFINNTVVLLKKNIPNGKVVVVEQDWTNNLFNRGYLINIVAKEYINQAKYIITHDVDINPLENTILKYYLQDVEEKSVLGILTSPCNTLAPIIKMQLNTFFNINGFPNDIWGWGAEDFALQKRAEYFNLKINKNLINHHRKSNEYFTHFNDINDRKQQNNTPNINKYELNNKPPHIKTRLVEHSGINNLNYKIIERKVLNDYVEMIKVTI